MSISIGIGTGQISNGQLFKGANGYAGEFGHMSIDYNGKRCRCGNKGCWELSCSEQFLLDAVASKLGLIQSALKMCLRKHTTKTLKC